MGPASVVVDGQQIDVAQVVRVRQVDTDRFVKVFVNHLAGFYDLTPTSMRLLTVLLQVVSDARYINADQIVLTEAIARETMKEHGQKPLSSASYYRAINELIASGFIAPTETPRCSSSTPPCCSTATGCASSQNCGGTERQQRKERGQHWKQQDRSSFL